MSVLWWQTDSVGVNTHIRTYDGSWPHCRPMASSTHVRWEDSSQSESRWRTNELAGMKPFLLKLFSWYCRAKHSDATFFRIISDITGPQSRQTMPVQVIIIITKGSMASVLRPLVTIGSPWLGIYLAECWFHNPHCAAVMASSLSPRIAILAKPSIKLVHYAGDADTMLIPTLQLPSWPSQ